MTTLLRWRHRLMRFFGLCPHAHQVRATFDGTTRVFCGECHALLRVIK